MNHDYDFTWDDIEYCNCLTIQMLSGFLGMFYTQLKNVSVKRSVFHYLFRATSVRVWQVLCWNQSQQLLACLYPEFVNIVMENIADRFLITALILCIQQLHIKLLDRHLKATSVFPVNKEDVKKEVVPWSVGELTISSIFFLSPCLV